MISLAEKCQPNTVATTRLSLGNCKVESLSSALNSN